MELEMRLPEMRLMSAAVAPGLVLSRVDGVGNARRASSAFVARQSFFASALVLALEDDKEIVLCLRLRATKLVYAARTTMQIFFDAF